MRLSTVTTKESGIVFREDFRNISAVASNGGTIVGTPTINNGLTVTVANTQGIYYNNTRTLLSGATKFTIKLKWTQVNAGDVNYFVTKYGYAKSMSALTSGSIFYLFINDDTINGRFSLTAGTYDLRIVYDGTQAVANNRLKIWNMATGTPVSVALTYTGTIPTSFPIGNDRIVVGGYDPTPSWSMAVGTIIYNVSIIQGLAWTTQEMTDDYLGQTYEKIRPEKMAVWLPLRSSYDADMGAGIKRYTSNLGSAGPAMLGDGTTAAKIPAQVFPCGVSFNGAQFLQMLDATTLQLTTTGSLLWCGMLGTTAAIMVLINKGVFATGLSGYTLYADGNAKTVYINLGDGVTYINRSASYNPRTLFTLIATWDGSFLYLYLNGVLAAAPVAQTRTPTGPNGKDLTIGVDDTKTGYFLAANSRVFASGVTSQPVTATQAKALHYELLRLSRI